MRTSTTLPLFLATLFTLALAGPPPVSSLLPPTNTRGPGPKPTPSTDYHPSHSFSVPSRSDYFGSSSVIESSKSESTKSEKSTRTETRTETTTRTATLPTDKPTGTEMPTGTPTGTATKTEAASSTETHAQVTGGAGGFSVPDMAVVMAGAMGAFAFI